MSTVVPDRWLGVEPRHLATFIAVAEAGSFRRAAHELGYVQSAVSQHVAQLERALGTQLIERDRGTRLRVTRSGRALLVHARRVVNHLRAACADVACLTGDEPLRVAAEPAAMALLSTLALTTGAGCEIAVSEAPSARLVDLVAAGDVDVALGACDDDGTAALGRRAVAEDHWVLVVPQDADWSAPDLHGKTLVEDRSHPLPVMKDGSPLGAERVIGCDRLSHALGLVRAGAGIAVLPRLGVSPTEPGVRCVELGDRLPPRPVSLIWLAARRFTGALAGVTTGERLAGAA